MNSAEFKDRIKRTAFLIQTSNQIIAFTGAGISTPSGIPDFRSPGKGMWETTDPMEVASIHTFHHKPQAFFGWLIPLIKVSMNAKPNLAHLALAKMEQIGKLAGIITQNIDSLHYAAGSKNVVEVHGSIREYGCMNCSIRISLEEISESLIEEKLPICPHCGRYLKPNITLFGEFLPANAMLKAEELCNHADLIIVIGSSLVVQPAANLPSLTLHKRGKLVINNLSPTPLDHLAEILLPNDVCETWTALMKELC
jgi:NAD-dependent deacetylase